MPKCPVPILTEKIPNLPECRVPVSRVNRTNTGNPGIVVEAISVPGVYLGGRTEITDGSGTGTEFIPNTLVWFGRVFFEQLPPVYCETRFAEHTLATF